MNFLLAIFFSPYGCANLCKQWYKGVVRLFVSQQLSKKLVLHVYKDNANKLWIVLRTCNKFIWFWSLHQECWQWHDSYPCTFECGHANCCQQMLSKTSVSLNGAGCSDHRCKQENQRVDLSPQIWSRTNDFGTVCCLCTASQYKVDAPARVSTSYRVFPRSSITHCKWGQNHAMAYCGYDKKEPKSSGNIWIAGLSNSHEFQKLEFASRWARKKLPAFNQKFVEANTLLENVSIGKVVGFQIKSVSSNNLWLLPAVTQLLWQYSGQAPASSSPSPSLACLEPSMFKILEAFFLTPS